MDLMEQRKTGKNFKCFGTRQSLLGDALMSFPILNFLEKQYPNSYKIFHLARKCSQMAPLLLNHPLIDRILISDCEEGFGPKDIEEMKACDIVLNTMPPYHSREDWPNFFTIFEETWLMSGLKLEDYHSLSEEEKRPKLVKWFNIEKQPKKTIALWPCAGYGNENKRNPSKEWYFNLTKKLISEGYSVIQFGHPKDYNFIPLILAPPYSRIDGFENFQSLKHLPFFDQIKMTLGCDLVISTDSGSGLIFGAYEMPQISLLTNHFPGHTRNLTAFAPNNLNNTNFIGVGNPDNISQEEVLKRVKELCL